LGRLGKDPEVRNLDNGAVVANFSIATSESYKDRTTGEKKEVT
jgi:single-strand DNA-binding protein